MKIKTRNLFLALAMLFAGFAPTALSAVTFSIAPAATSNTYSGTLTLQVSGLTGGDTVVVQKFLDANTNGVVDAGDLLMQQFQLTDGQASVFMDGATAVTNFNVPGDTDGSANGSITAKLHPSFDFSQMIVGKYLLVLSSPAGHFSPQTNSFAVTNFPFAQSISGNVVNNGTNVPNAVVILFQPSAGNNLNPVGGVVANNSGGYSINAAPGTYWLGGVKSNFVANLAVSPNVNLLAGVPITTNVPMTNATTSISGNVIDLNNSSIGLAGYLVPFQTANYLLAIAFTDTNGNYEMEGYTDTNGNYVAGALGGDSWQVSIDHSSLTNYIFSQGQNTTLSSGQAYRYDFTALLAANHIAGNVQFNGTNVTGVQVYADATIGTNYYQSEMDTDAKGNYSLNVANGTWNVNVYDCGCSDNDSLNNVLGGANYQDPGSQNVTINNDKGTANFTVLPANSGQIFGYVFDAYGNPVAGVGIYASDGLGDNYSTSTDGTGYYSLVAANGSYNVSVDCAQLNARNYNCPSADSASVSDNSIEADFNVQFLAAPTYPFTTLHGFSATAIGANTLATNSDGASPYGGLLLSGNTLYGTAAYGGTNGAGTVFSVNTNITGFAVVHTFAAAATDMNGVYTNSDGGLPGAGLILSSNLLYSTAYYGGTNGNGTVFAVNTNGAGFRVLHTFTALDATTQITNTDGANPNAALVLSSNILYSTAAYGGTNGNGTVFAVATNGSFTVVHSFTGLDPIFGTNNDGAIPWAGLILSGGTLYGTAIYGGTNGAGTVFKVNTNGTGFTTLYSFTGGDDGANPYAGLVLSSNILYGTASAGGQWDAGTVFAISTNGTGFTVLHTFTGGDDGATPYAGLILSNNTLYGTAANSGSSDSGTVFAVSINGTNFTVLHGFTGGDDGAYPYDSLILSGNTLYGTTAGGGQDGDGTVFALSITPSSVAPTISSPARFPNGQFQMTVNAPAGQNYTVQMSTNLISTNWVPLLVTNPPSSSFLFSDPNGTNKQRFYRIWVGP